MAAGSDFAASLVNEKARTGRIVHQDTMPSLAPIRRRPPIQSYATIDNTTADNQLNNSATAYHSDTMYNTRRSRLQGAASLQLHPTTLAAAPRLSSPDYTIQKRRPPLLHGACFDTPDSDNTIDPHSPRQSEELTPRHDTDDETPSRLTFLGDNCLAKKSISFHPDSSSLPEKSGSSDSKLELLESKYNHKSSDWNYFSDDIFPEHNSSCFKADNNYTSYNVNDPHLIQRMSVTALFEKFCADEREVQPRPSPVKPASEHSFGRSRFRGISGDSSGSGFNKKNRNSNAYLGNHPSSGSCFSLFCKQTNKLGMLEKSKRFSSSALYEQTPVGHLPNFNGIRSSEFYQKSNSDECQFQYSSSDGTFSSTNEPSTSRYGSYMYNENPLERESVMRLYEKFSCDGEEKLPASAKVVFKLAKKQSPDSRDPKSEPCSATGLHEKISNIISSTITSPIATDANVFDFDVDVIQRKCSENKSDILSLNGSISVSNTVQLLFEDPRSNRTSVSDLYEPCFSISLSSKRSSFKRDYPRHLDLNALDLRPIDDESPTSKYNSVSNADDGLQNFDSKSITSDVFITSEFSYSVDENSERNIKSLALEDIYEGDYPENVFSSPESKKDFVRKSSKVSFKFRMKNKETNECSSVNTVPISNNKEERAVEQDDVHAKVTPDKPDKRTLLDMKKVLDEDSVAVRKRTRCFPL
ncbi:hypothetical protein CBL_03780 [Carabus blaptoides fortunei]